jgi:hypothetical protein
MAVDDLDPSNPLHGDLQTIQSPGRRAAILTRELLACS